MPYKYNPEMASNEGNAGDWPLLAEDDYPFSVTSCSFPMENDKGYDVCEIELLVDGQRIWDYRSAGVGPKGKFDMITPFLVAINRIPKKGEENSPTFWRSLCGARGRVHLIQNEYGGKIRNKVGWYHTPKQVGPTAEQAPRLSYSPEEYKRASTEAVKKAGGQDPNLDVAPDDIPF